MKRCSIIRSTVVCMAAAASHPAAGVVLGTLDSNQEYYTSWSSSCPQTLALQSSPQSTTGECSQAGTPSPNGDILFSWGALGETRNGVSLNSVREIEYSGTQSFQLSTNNSFTFTANESVGNTASPNPGTPVVAGSGANVAWEWGGLNPTTVSPTRTSEARVQIRIVDGDTDAEKAVRSFSVFGSSDLRWWISPFVTQTPLSEQPYGLGAGNSPRLDPGDKVQFTFYEGLWNGAAATQALGVPDVVYGDIEVQFNGTALNAGAIGLNPSTLNLGPVRAGSGATVNASTAISNIGGANTLLTGEAGTATGSFSGGGVDFELRETDPAVSVQYGYTAAADLNGGNTARVDQQAVTITNDSGDDATLNLTGTTVGPVFNAAVSGVSDNQGGTIDFGKVLFTKDPGADTTEDQTVTLTNTFQSPVANAALTRMTVAGTASGVGFSGSVSDTIESQGNTPADQTPVVLTFDPTRPLSPTTSGGVGYNGSIDFATDVGAALGGDGVDYTYTLTGEAYLALMEQAAGTGLNFGNIRIGATGATGTGSATASIRNITGGGFALNNVQFGEASDGSATTTLSRIGTGSVSSVTDGVTGGADYRLSVTGLAASSTAQAVVVSETATVASDEAPDVDVTISGTAQAVGPDFALSAQTDTAATVDNTEGSREIALTYRFGELNPNWGLNLNNRFDTDLGDLTTLNVDATATSIDSPFSTTLGGKSAAGGDTSTGFQVGLTTDGSSGYVGTLGAQTDQGAAENDFSNGRLFTYDVSASAAGANPNAMVTTVFDYTGSDVTIGSGGTDPDGQPYDGTIDLGNFIIGQTDAIDILFNSIVGGTLGDVDNVTIGPLSLAAPPSGLPGNIFPTDSTYLNLFLDAPDTNTELAPGDSLDFMLSLIGSGEVFARLLVPTDVGAAGGLGDVAGGRPYVYLVRGIGITPVPVPGPLVLVLVGLALLARTRRT